MDWQAGKFTSAGRLGCGWPQGLTPLSVAGEKRHGCVSSAAVGQPELSSTEALALQSGKTLLLAPGELQLFSAGP